MRVGNRIHRGALLTALLLAGCEARDEAPAAESPAPSRAEETTASTPAPGAAPAPETLVDSLAGEWRVAGIDGVALDEPVGIALSGDGDELWWEPRCAGLVRSYRISGPSIAFGPAGDAAALPRGAPPPPVCAIAVPPRITDLTRAIDSAETVGRTPANGIMIEGGGHSVLLFSQ